MRAITKTDTEKAVKHLNAAISSRDTQRTQKMLQHRAVQNLLKPGDYNGKIRHLKRKARERK